MDIHFVRTIRTAHSERFLLRDRTRDIAAVDIHFLESGKGDATLIVFDDSGLSEQQVPELLTTIDEVLLPNVSVDEGNLSFTVVFGRVVGAFLPEVAKPA